MDHARNILESLINKNIPAKNTIISYMAADMWNEIIDLKKISWVDRVSKGTIYVHSENPSFVQDAMFRKREIVEKLNSSVGEKVIKDLKFIISSQKKEESSEEKKASW